KPRAHRRPRGTSLARSGGITDRTGEPRKAIFAGIAGAGPVRCRGASVGTSPGDAGGGTSAPLRMSRPVVPPARSARPAVADVLGLGQEPSRVLQSSSYGLKAVRVGAHGVSLVEPDEVAKVETEIPDEVVLHAERY